MDRFYLPTNKITNGIFYSLIIIITIFMIIGMLYLEIDSDVTKLLPVNAQTIAEKEKITNYKKDFPSSDSSIFLSVEFTQMTDSEYKKLNQLCKELENIEYKGAKLVSSILSPFNAVYFKKVGNTFIPKTVYSGSSLGNMDSILTEISQNRYLIGSVLSYDKKSIGILINMNETAIIKGIEKKNIYHFIGEKLFGKNYGDSLLTRVRFCDEVEKVYMKYEKDFNIYTAGVPIYESKSKKYMMRDIVALIIPAIIMMVFVLFLNFRSVRGTFLPMLGMVMSLIWTLGLMGWMRQSLNVVGILIPPLILTLGSSYTLHYINSYYLHSKEKDRNKLVISSTKAIFPTISMAAITTIIGFASFFTAKMDSIRIFGAWIIISILFTLFFTFFLLSKVLVNLTPPKDEHVHSVKNDFFSKILNLIQKIVIPYYMIWIILFIGSIFLFAFTLNNIKIETNAANFFKNSDPVKKSMVFLQKNFKGTVSFNISIKSKDNTPYFFKTRKGLLIAQEIENFINDNPGLNGLILTGWRLSPVTMIEDINKIVNDQEGIPEDQNLIDRFYNLIYASKNAQINSIINTDLSAINIQVRTYSDREKVGYVITEQELAAINQFYNDNFRKIEEKYPNIKIETWGEIILLSKISKYLFEDQIGSLAFTFFLIIVVTMIIFKSFFYALISTIPLLFGIMMNFSIMSLFNISLDAATIMIGAISMGVGIDSSLHFILNYRKSIKDTQSTKEALERTLAYTSRPIFFASLALIAGFLVFLISTFRPVFFFGLLISISMLNCTIATLLILPSFIMMIDKIKSLKKK